MELSYSDLSEEAHELILYCENDPSLYRQEQMIEANLDKHLAKGRFDATLAAKAFRHEVDAGARMYQKEYGSGSRRSDQVFSVKHRQEAAEFMAKAYIIKRAPSGMRSR